MADACDSVLREKESQERKDEYCLYDVSIESAGVIQWWSEGKWRGSALAVVSHKAMAAFSLLLPVVVFVHLWHIAAASRRAGIFATTYACICMRI